MAEGIRSHSPPNVTISFGGIPNSSRLSSLMPGLTTWAHSCSAVVLPMRTMSSPKNVQKQSHGCPCQGCKFSGTFRKLHPEPTPAHTGTLRNLPEPASGTYTSTHRNPPEPASGTYTSTHQNPPEPSGNCLRNLHQRTPEPSGTFRNLPPEPTPAHTGTFRNLPRNLHQRTLEPSGTFWNLPPEPAPATRTGTHRSLSGLKTPLAYAVGEKSCQKYNIFCK